MKQTRFRAIGIILSAVLFCAQMVNAANGTWNGTVNKVWTNSANWSASPFPSGTETATFNNKTAGAIQEIDIDSYLGCTNVVFDNANVAHYRIGTNATLQTFILRSTNTASIFVTGAAGSNQTFNSILQLGADALAGTYTITNGNANRTLTFLGAMTNGLGGTAGTKTLNINGTGPVVATGGITKNGTLNVNVNSTAAVTIGGPNTINTLIRNSTGALTITGPSTLGTLTQNSTGALAINADSTIDFVTQSAQGTITLTNTILKTLTMNVANGIVNIATGATLTFTNAGADNLIGSQDATINGPGVILLSNGVVGDYANNYAADGKTLTINAKITGARGLEYYGGSTTGTFVLTAENDYTLDTIFNKSGTLRFSTIRNKGVACNLGSGNAIRFKDNAGGRLHYVGIGDTTDREIVIKNSGIIEQSGSGLLKFTGPFYQDAAAANSILALQGSTTGSGEISGPISNNHATATLGITKTGTGIWTLSGVGSYKGATSVSNGTLVIAGTAGSITNTSSIALSTGGTLTLLNRFTANHANRLNDSVPITMSGGKLEFFNNGGDANYSEIIGAITIAGNNNSTLSTSRAVVGKTSTLTISSITRNIGALNFVGESLGVDARNRIFITGQADGLIGSWATVNGTAYAAYSSERGVYAADGAVIDSTDIAARGPDSIIPEGAGLKVRIATDGVSGPIELTNTTTTITSLLQGTGTDAVVNMSGKTLRAWTLVAPDGKAPLTIGQAVNEGVLAPNQADSSLTLNISGSGALTVNSVVANNGSKSDLIKSGSGVASLKGENTFTGDTSIYEGSLVLANSNALQYSRLTRDGVVFDSSVSSHRFTLGSLTNGYTSGWYILNLLDNALNPVTLAVGNNNANSVYSGDIASGGLLEKIGTGDLRISGDLHHTGGTTVSAGSLTAGSALSLGYGPVVNNGTINLQTGGLTYQGLSVSLSGAGTVNVLALGAGTTTVALNGNYSGFTGVWNIGPNVPAGAGKVQMAGLDNAAATINLFTNATLYCSAAGMHYATINLHGGDTGESIGQLRLDNATWAGPVNIKAASTNIADGLIGSNGTGYIPGVIDDAGAGIVMDKAGGGMLVVSGPNTYTGPTWVKQGTLQVPWCGNVADLYSPLGKGGKIMLGVLATGGRLQCAGTNDVTDRPVEMAGTTANAHLKHVGLFNWTLSGDITSPLAGNKRLQLEGNVGTTGILSGVISDSLTSTNNILKLEAGAWVLSGNNTFKGNVQLDDGQMIVKHNRALGIGPKTAQAANNAGGANPYFILDGSDGDLTIPSDISFLTSDVTQGAIVNVAGDNTIQGQVRLMTGDGDTILSSIAGRLTITGDVFPVVTARLLRFWGASDGEISGVISNGSTTTGLPLWKDSGSGSWLLSGNNTYTGSTTVTTGRIAVGGVNGRIALGAGIIINGGAFAITNSTDASSSDRIDDNNRVTMSGGTFSYGHPDVGEQPYSETLGVLAISSGLNTISSSQAAPDWSSTLTFDSLSRTGGTIDFVGANLGDNANARNRIKINSQPDGLIGTWATVNGTSFAAYDSVRGVYAADPVTPIGIAAKGDTITNDAMATVEITLEGSGETNVLEGATENSVNILKQASEWPSTVFMPGKTLKVADVVINAGQAALTIGQSVNEGLVMGLNAGSYLDLVNDSTTALTINAGVTNNGTGAMGLTKWGTGPANIAGRVSYTGPTVVGAGTLEFSSGTTQTLSGVISGSGAITKSGIGQLTLSAANTFTGDFTISGGTVISGNNAALGTIDGETIINGGTLAFSAARDHGAERVKVQGAGVDNLGAIVSYAAADSPNAFRFVTLTGDTTFGGTRRWDIRAAGTPATATFDMGGFTLTKTNSNDIALQNVTFETPGHIVVNQGLLRVEFNTPLGGTEANTFMVKPGAKLDTYNQYWPIAWSVTAEENAMITAGSSQSVTQNIYNAGINLTGKVYFNAAGFQTFNGPITNSGSVVKMGVSTNYFNNAANTYTGTTVISNGLLYAKYAGSLPGADSAKVTVMPGAYLHLPVATNGSDFGWTSAQIGAISPSTFVNSNAWLILETFGDFDHTSNFPQSPSSMGLRKLGVGTMTIPQNQTLLGGLFVQGGALVLNNVILQTGQITTELALNAVETASLTLSGNSVLTSFLNTNNTPGGAQALVVGRAGRATLLLKDNAVVTNKLYLGDATTSAGAVYQSGNSTMYNWGGSANDGRLGNNGYGYYELNSGTFTNHGFFQMGGGSTTGTGVLVQKGGMFYQNNTYGGQFALNRGGTGIIYTDGGTFGTVNQIVLGETSGTSTTSGNAIFTADGNANVTIAGNITMSDRINAFSAVNLNGGTVSASQFSKGNRTGNSAFVNFDGGTFKSRVNGALFATGVSAPTAVNIYGGGAIFDTGAFSNTVDVALLAPAGKCVSAISISQGSGYIGPPAVIISGGGGAGATALASFDSANGTVTGIQITSPGAGYTSTPTVTLTGGSCTNVAAVVTGVLLANNVSGGLAKNGSGMLTLTAANTYTGPTVVNQGVLRLGAPGAIYMDSDIIINGGVLDLNGYTLVTRASVTVNAGSIVNGVIISESLDKSTTSTATVGASVESITPVTIAGGTYKLTATVATVQPGLLQGKISNNAFDITSINPSTVVTNSPAMGNSQTGWGNNETYIYSGYIWNRAMTNVTWTFAEHIDDSVLLKIDGNTVLNNTAWQVPSLASYVLTPGAHTFEARFGNGIGNTGPSTQAGTWFPANNSFGIGVDYQGSGATNIANFVSMVDPGDGSLFTTALPAFSENTAIALAAGATLDLNGTTQIIANLSGSGTVTNGTLVITGLVTPAGEAIGDLTFNCNLTITGRIVLDVSASLNDRLIVSGNLDVSGADLEVVNAATMPKQNYTIATANGTITGSPSGDFIPWISNPDENNWKVKQEGTSIKLIYLGGTIILLH